MKKYKGFLAGLIVGGGLMMSMPAMAAAVKQYVLVEAIYPLVVNETIYSNSELPVLNYKGSTYIPLRAAGDLLGASVKWNGALRQVEIETEYREHLDNNAFRNIQVSGSGGFYTVAGEARVFEAVMNYSVEDGHRYLLEDFHVLNEGAPAWSPFSFDIVISQHRLPVNGTLTLELFEYSAKDGNRIHSYIVPLETFIP